MDSISADLLKIAGNVILVPVLIWFMKQNTRLIQTLIDRQDRTNDVVAHNTAALQQMKDVIAKCDR